VWKWFARFRVGNFNVKDAKRLGRSRTVNTDKITILVDANPHLMIREIQVRKFLVMSHGSIVAHLRDAVMREWMVPHELSDRNLQQSLDACHLLLEKNKEPFLKKITEDEKWIIYNNVKRKMFWKPKDSYLQTAAKAGFQRR